MSELIHCHKHGNLPGAILCRHLARAGEGLGFHSDEPTDDMPIPDAWCDACEDQWQADDCEWTDAMAAQTDVQFVCGECWFSARLANLAQDSALDELAGLRWKCSDCDLWHTGPMLDVGFDLPAPWSAKRRKSGASRKARTFLDTEYCAIDGEHFFIRGVIRIPILGTPEHFCWGVWGSLSRENFYRLVERDETRSEDAPPPMFSWLSNTLPGYPSDGSIKMMAHVQQLGTRPLFELEATTFALAVEQRRGISVQRVKELMLERLPAVEA